MFNHLIQDIVCEIVVVVVAVVLLVSSSGGRGFLGGLSCEAEVYEFGQLGEAVLVNGVHFDMQLVTFHIFDRLRAELLNLLDHLVQSAIVKFSNFIGELQLNFKCDAIGILSCIVFLGLRLLWFSFLVSSLWN